MNLCCESLLWNPRSRTIRTVKKLGGNSCGEYDLRDQQHEQGMDHRLVLNFRNCQGSWSFKAQIFENLVPGIGCYPTPLYPLASGSKCCFLLLVLSFFFGDLNAMYLRFRFHLQMKEASLAHLSWFSLSTIKA